MDFPIGIRYALDVPCSKIGLYWPIKRHSPTEMTFAPTLRGTPSIPAGRSVDDRQISRHCRSRPSPSGSLLHFQNRSRGLKRRSFPSPRPISNPIIPLHSGRFPWKFPETRRGDEDEYVVQQADSFRCKLGRTFMVVAPFRERSGSASFSFSRCFSRRVNKLLNRDSPEERRYERDEWKSVWIKQSNICGISVPAKPDARVEKRNPNESPK